MHLDDDTFWHVGVQLRIYEAPNVSPQDLIRLRFRIKKSELDAVEFKVIFGLDGPEFVVAPSAPSSLIPIYEAVHRGLIEHYGHDFDNFLRDGKLKGREPLPLNLESN